MKITVLYCSISVISNQLVEEGLKYYFNHERTNYNVEWNFCNICYVSDTFKIDKCHLVILMGNVLKKDLLEKMKNIIINHKGPIYGINIITSDKVELEDVSFIDHIFLRHKCNSVQLTRLLGSPYTHVIPDMRFMINYKNMCNNDTINNEQIAIFLDSILLNTPKYCLKIILFIKKLCIKEDRNIILYRLNPNGLTNDEYDINEHIIKSIDNDKVIHDKNVYNITEICNVINNSKYVITMKYTPCVIAIKLLKTFYTISLSASIDQLMEENNLEKYNISFKNNNNITEDDIYNMIKKEIKQTKLLKINELIEISCKSKQIIRLLKEKII